MSASKKNAASPVGSRTRIAVVGAGLSGLNAARILAAHGIKVTVFEKSRGVGGRMSTRRAEGQLRFDHGAQYFTVRDDSFRQMVETWERAGVVQLWDGRIGVISRDQPVEFRDGPPRYVAKPGMNSICKHLASELHVVFETRVGRIERDEGAWRLADVEGVSLGSFDGVIVSAPARQTAELLSADPKISAIAEACTMEPCWAALIAFDETLALEFDGAFVHDAPLSWVACNSRKPGREGRAECWVLHATPEWTRDNLFADRESIASTLLEVFFEVARSKIVEPLYATSHFWRYAIPSEPLDSRYVMGDEAGLAACGDWCGGPRVEGAFLSGAAAAEKIYLTLSQ